MKRFILAFGLSALTLMGLRAQDVIGDEDLLDEVAAEAEADAEAATPSVLDEKIIPEAFPDARYEKSWNTNPFLKVTTAPVTPKKDWSEDWALSSMFKSETGKITVGLQNKQTGDYKRVTSEDGANSEFRLILANFNRNRNEASADIEKSGVKATIKYDDNLTSKPVTINNTFKAPAAAGQPGALPNARPGQPNQPVNVAQPGQPAVLGAPASPSGGIPGRPGLPPGVGTQSPASPPTISRRRNLIPVPVAPPPQQQ